MKRLSLFFFHFGRICVLYGFLQWLDFNNIFAYFELWDLFLLPAKVSLRNGLEQGVILLISIQDGVSSSPSSEMGYSIIIYYTYDIRSKNFTKGNSLTSSWGPWERLSLLLDKIRRWTHRHNVCSVDAGSIWDWWNQKEKNVDLCLECIRNAKCQKK